MTAFVYMSVFTVLSQVCVYEYEYVCMSDLMYKRMWVCMGVHVYCVGMPVYCVCMCIFCCEYIAGVCICII